jgi:hypothetical protein
VDDVLTCHSDFLDCCLKDCMLTDPTLLRTVNKLMAVCVQFCHFIQVIFSSEEYSYGFTHPSLGNLVFTYTQINAKRVRNISIIW